MDDVVSLDLWIHPDGRHTWRDPSSPWYREPASPWIRHGAFRLRQWGADFGLLPGEAERLPEGTLCADSNNQTGGLGGPRFIYRDIQTTCRDCSCPFVFTAAEQKHWFEVLKLWNETIPSACATCRRQRRVERTSHTRLAEAIAQLKLHPDDAHAHLQAARATLALAELVGLPALQRGLWHARAATKDLAEADGLVQQLQAVLQHRTTRDGP